MQAIDELLCKPESLSLEEALVLTSSLGKRLSSLSTTDNLPLETVIGLNTRFLQSWWPLLSVFEATRRITDIPQHISTSTPIQLIEDYNHKASNIQVIRNYRSILQTGPIDGADASTSSANQIITPHVVRQVMSMLINTVVANQEQHDQITPILTLIHAMCLDPETIQAAFSVKEHQAFEKEHPFLKLLLLENISVENLTIVLEIISLVFLHYPELQTVSASSSRHITCLTTLALNQTDNATAVLSALLLISQLGSLASSQFDMTSLKVTPFSPRAQLGILVQMKHLIGKEEWTNMDTILSILSILSLMSGTDSAYPQETDALVQNLITRIDGRASSKKGAFRALRLASIKQSHRAAIRPSGKMAPCAMGSRWLKLLTTSSDPSSVVELSFVYSHICALGLSFRVILDVLDKIEDQNLQVKLAVSPLLAFFGAFVAGKGNVVPDLAVAEGTAFEICENSVSKIKVFLDKILEKPRFGVAVIYTLLHWIRGKAPRGVLELGSVYYGLGGVNDCLELFQKLEILPKLAGLTTLGDFVPDILICLSGIENGPVSSSSPSKPAVLTDEFKSISSSLITRILETLPYPEIDTITGPKFRQYARISQLLPVLDADPFARYLEMLQNPPLFPETNNVRLNARLLSLSGILALVRQNLVDSRRRVFTRLRHIDVDRSDATDEDPTPAFLILGSHFGELGSQAARIQAEILTLCLPTESKGLEQVLSNICCEITSSLAASGTLTGGVDSHQLPTEIRAEDDVEPVVEEPAVAAASDSEDSTCSDTSPSIPQTPTVPFSHTDISISISIEFLFELVSLSTGCERTTGVIKRVRPIALLLALLPFAERLVRNTAISFLLEICLGGETRDFALSKMSLLRISSSPLLFSLLTRAIAPKPPSEGLALVSRVLENMNGSMSLWDLIYSCGDDDLVKSYAVGIMSSLASSCQPMAALNVPLGPKTPRGGISHLPQVWINSAEIGPFEMLPFEREFESDPFKRIKPEKIVLPSKGITISIWIAPSFLDSSVDDDSTTHGSHPIPLLTIERGSNTYCSLQLLPVEETSTDSTKKSAAIIRYAVSVPGFPPMEASLPLTRGCIATAHQCALPRMQEDTSSRFAHGILGSQISGWRHLTVSHTMTGSIAMFLDGALVATSEEGGMPMLPIPHELFEEDGPRVHVLSGPPPPSDDALLRQVTPFTGMLGPASVYFTALDAKDAASMFSMPHKLVDEQSLLFHFDPVYMGNASSAHSLVYHLRTAFKQMRGRLHPATAGSDVREIGEEEVFSTSLPQSREFEMTALVQNNGSIPASVHLGSSPTAGMLLPARPAVKGVMRGSVVFGTRLPEDAECGEALKIPGFEIGSDFARKLPDLVKTASPLFVSSLFSLLTLIWPIYPSEQSVEDTAEDVSDYISFLQKEGVTLDPPLSHECVRFGSIDGSFNGIPGVLSDIVTAKGSMKSFKFFSTRFWQSLAAMAVSNAALMRDSPMAPVQGIISGLIGRDDDQSFRSSSPSFIALVSLISNPRFPKAHLLPALKLLRPYLVTRPKSVCESKPVPVSIIPTGEGSQATSGTDSHRMVSISGASYLLSLIQNALTRVYAKLALSSETTPTGVTKVKLDSKFVNMARQSEIHLLIGSLAPFMAYSDVNNLINMALNDYPLKAKRRSSTQTVNLDAGIAIRSVVLEGILIGVCSFPMTGSPTNYHLQLTNSILGTGFVSKMPALLLRSLPQENNGFFQEHALLLRILSGLALVSSFGNMRDRFNAQLISATRTVNDTVSGGIIQAWDLLGSISLNSPDPKRRKLRKNTPRPTISVPVFSSWISILLGSPGFDISMVTQSGEYVQIIYPLALPVLLGMVPHLEPGKNADRVLSLFADILTTSDEDRRDIYLELPPSVEGQTRLTFRSPEQTPVLEDILKYGDCLEALANIGECRTVLAVPKPDIVLADSSGDLSAENQWTQTLKSADRASKWATSLVLKILLLEEFSDPCIVRGITSFQTRGSPRRKPGESTFSWELRSNVPISHPSFFKMIFEEIPTIMRALGTSAYTSLGAIYRLIHNDNWFPLGSRVLMGSRALEPVLAICEIALEQICPEGEFSAPWEELRLCAAGRLLLATPDPRAKYELVRSVFTNLERGDLRPLIEEAGGLALVIRLAASLSIMPGQPSCVSTLSDAIVLLGQGNPKMLGKYLGVGGTGIVLDDECDLGAWLCSPDRQQQVAKMIMLSEKALRPFRRSAVAFLRNRELVISEAVEEWGIPPLWHDYGLQPAVALSRGPGLLACLSQTEKESIYSLLK
eukprot:gnl/Dysnectes_brevis/3407_a4291_761.p1 GENE.gnl/Dysnectes_brevis/3407_a4291_761~~gnl/Dysnectes_brevis/3407_a4291_761.p1  ORF type:complete len:2282 (-),score=146.20 gnl/Dysnectes_brevis/3407_a4291_761:40-6861(-)